MLENFFRLICHPREIMFIVLYCSLLLSLLFYLHILNGISNIIKYIVLTLINSITVAQLYNQSMLISPVKTEDDQRMIETCLVFLKLLSFFLKSIR